MKNKSKLLLIASACFGLLFSMDILAAQPGDQDEMQAPESVSAPGTTARPGSAGTTQQDSVGGGTLSADGECDGITCIGKKCCDGEICCGKQKGCQKSCSDASKLEME